MTEDYSSQAIERASNAPLAYCKFIKANDTGATGGHQSGFHIHKASWPVLFDAEGHRGENKDRKVKIRWQDDFETESRFIYYGTGTRNEYRITGFGKGFPYLKDEMIGSLLVLCRLDAENYRAYVLQSEMEIDNFLEYFGISPLEANGLVKKLGTTGKDLISLIQNEVALLGDTFPDTTKLSEVARTIYAKTHNNPNFALTNPDEAISRWVETEYSLFKELEKIIYRPYLHDNFESIDTLVEVANTILNRRKSRAGKSLEHHLAKIFDAHKLPYSAQPITEGRKKPDFIMPSIEAYRDPTFDEGRLTFLGAKTTCKDRWRQVINEANRIHHKHLFTLQPTISSGQLKEMKDENLTLVIPESNLKDYPKDADNVMSLKNFIDFSKSKNLTSLEVEIF